MRSENKVLCEHSRLVEIAEAVVDPTRGRTQAEALFALEEELRRLRSER